jgi:hypothetical protein
MACRLVLEGGFHPDDVTPRPPFVVSRHGLLSFDAEAAGSGEEIVLGGLKTKNVDVVVTKPKIGPVLAISCKGATKAFRNLTNRMEETIGECTNLHMTYPALVIGYFVLLRAIAPFKMLWRHRASIPMRRWFLTNQSQVLTPKNRLSRSTRLNETTSRSAVRENPMKKYNGSLRP